MCARTDGTVETNGSKHVCGTALCVAVQSGRADARSGPELSEGSGHGACSKGNDGGGVTHLELWFWEE